MKQQISAIILALLISTGTISSQTILIDNNMISLVNEDFNEEKSVFPILMSKDNYFIIDNGDYLISRNNTETEYAVLVSNKKLISDFRLRSSIKLGPSPNKRSSAGIILKASGTEKQMIVFELNRKSEFRIKQLLPNNTYKYLSGKPKNEGWVKNKIIKREGEYNAIEIRCIENVFDIYINNYFLTTLFSPNLKNGKMGIMISKDAKARIGNYYLDIPSQEKNDLIEKQKKNNNLITLKNRINELESENKSLINSNERLENDLSTNRNFSISKYNDCQDSLKKIIKSNVEIAKKNNEEYNIINSKLESLKSENKRLKSEKENLEKKIIRNENNIETKNNKILSIEKKNDQITQQIKEKSDEISKLSSQLESTKRKLNSSNNLATNLKNELIELSELMSEIKSKNNNEINSLKDLIENKKSEINALNNDLSSQKRELNSIKKKYPNLENIYKENKNLKNNLIEKENNTLSLIEKINTLEKEIKTLMSKEEISANSISDKTKEIETLTSTINKLSIEIESMKEVLIYKGFQEKGIDSEKVEVTNLTEKIKEKETTYSVQIATYGNKVQIAQFKGLLDVFYYETNNGTFLYMSGKFNNSNDAIEHKNKLVKAGYENAFIVELNNK